MKEITLTRPRPRNHANETMLNGTTFNETTLARLQSWMILLTRHTGRTLREGALLDIIRYRPDAHDRHCMLLGFSIRTGFRFGFRF